MQKRVVFLAPFIILFSACTSTAISPDATPSAPIAVIVPDTPVPTKTSIPTPTPTIEELIYPYTIAGLRQHDFQSGKVHIRETLFQNEQYTTYYIDYPSDGLTITGIMQIPVGEGPFPVIVMNHGYFNRDVYTSGDGTDRSAEILVKRGYITISPDFRSWGASDVGPSFFYSGLAIDVVNLLNAIPSIPEADSERIGMWGHSMGGGVTMKVLAIEAGRVAAERHIETRVKAAVLYSTVSADFSDVIARWGPGCYGDIAAGEQLFGCNSSDIIPDTLSRRLQDAYMFAVNNPDTLNQMSPFYYLTDITIPIQINYGAEDGQDFTGTPPDWSKKLYEAFQEAGNENVELFGYDGEGHSFKPDAWFAFMGRTSIFFDANVKNAP